MFINYHGCVLSTVFLKNDDDDDDDDDNDDVYLLTL